MEKIIFPNSELKSLEDLSNILAVKSGDICIEIESGKYFGSLILKDLKCSSLSIVGKGKTIFSGAKVTSAEFFRFGEVEESQLSGKKFAEKKNSSLQLNSRSSENINAPLIGQHGEKEINGRHFDSLSSDNATNNFSSALPEMIVARLDKGLCFDRIKVNGDEKRLARFPNFDKNVFLGGVTTFSEAEKRSRGWKNSKTGYMRSLHGNEWGGNAYNIISADNGKINLAWIGNNNRGDSFKKDCVIIENIFEELDSEDEFWYDKLTGELFLLESHFDGEKKFLELMTKTEIVSIKDCKDTMIKMENIAFEDTNRSMFAEPWVRYLRSDWAFNFASAVRISNSKNIKIDHCSFNSLGSNAVGITSYAENVEIVGCTFTDSSTNGVLIAGDADSTYNTSSWENNYHVKTMQDSNKIGAKNKNYPRNITVTDCYFYNLGTVDKQSAPICLSLCKDVTIDGCTIHHVPRAGINICENSFGGHVIQNCDIFDCVRETGDHGPFNSWGRDRFWSLKGFNTVGKFGKEKKPFALADMESVITFRHNRIVGKSGFGIDLDDGSTNYLIEYNYCQGVGIKLREGFFRTVRNNIIVNAPFDLHVSFCGNDDILYDNVVVSSKPINAVLLNRGHTTTIADNIFIGANAALKESKLLKNEENKFFANMETRELEKIFRKINKNYDTGYGKNGFPTPKIFVKNEITENQNTKFIWKGCFLKVLDEGLRSSTGAPNCNGKYVEKVRVFSSLRHLGLKKGDVILAVNGETIVEKTNILEREDVSQLELVRNQKTIIMKK